MWLYSISLKKKKLKLIINYFIASHFSGQSGQPKAEWLLRMFCISSGSGCSPSAVPVQAVRVAAAAGARRKRRSCDTGRARSLASLAEEAARSPVFVLQTVLGFSRQDFTLPGPPLFFIFLLFFLFKLGLFFLVYFT